MREFRTSVNFLSRSRLNILKIYKWSEMNVSELSTVVPSVIWSPAATRSIDGRGGDDMNRRRWIFTWISHFRFDSTNETCVRELSELLHGVCLEMCHMSVGFDDILLFLAAKKERKISSCRTHKSCNQQTRERDIASRDWIESSEKLSLVPEQRKKKAKQAR